MLRQKRYDRNDIETRKKQKNKEKIELQVCNLTKTSKS